MAGNILTATGVLGDSDYRNSNLGASADNDVNGGAALVYVIEIDNTANSAVTYFKAWNSAAPTVGTTAPNLQIRVPAGETATWVKLAGYNFATGLSMACLTTKGTSGTTAPSSAVDVTIRLA